MLSIQNGFITRSMFKVKNQGTTAFEHPNPNYAIADPSSSRLEHVIRTNIVKSNLSSEVLAKTARSYARI
ncbi:hypothetical protein M0804_000280 [Polistes exclamans]|nr:hypothetical protein M0804_000280 [Polistes exclamans]